MHSSNGYYDNSPIEVKANGSTTSICESVLCSASSYYQIHLRFCNCNNAKQLTNPGRYMLTINTLNVTYISQNIPSIFIGPTPPSPASIVPSA
jgi:hypothetical protein